MCVASRAAAAESTTHRQSAQRSTGSARHMDRFGGIVANVIGQSARVDFQHVFWLHSVGGFLQRSYFNESVDKAESAKNLGHYSYLSFSIFLIPYRSSPTNGEETRVRDHYESSSKSIHRPLYPPRNEGMLCQPLNFLSEVIFKE